MKTALGILLAGGKGTRFGLEKQNLLLQDKPLWVHSLLKFQQAGFFTQIYIVIPPGQQSSYEELALKHQTGPINLIPGGSERHHSVRNALTAAKEFLLPGNHVFIHDTARPLFRMETLFLLRDALDSYPAATLGYPVTDALKRADEKGIIQGEIERTHAWAVTTPQAFHADTLYTLFQEAPDFAYDETYLFTRQNLPVKIIAAGRYNLKVTYPEDFQAAQKLF